MKCRLGFISLHVSKKTRLFYISQKALHVALSPSHYCGREALSLRACEPAAPAREHPTSGRLKGLRLPERKTKHQGPIFRKSELLFPVKRAQRWYLCFCPGLLKAINGEIKWFFAAPSSALDVCLSTKQTLERGRLPKQAARHLTGCKWGPQQQLSWQEELTLCYAHSHQGAVYLGYMASLVPCSSRHCHTGWQVVSDPKAWHSAHKSSQ